MESQTRRNALMVGALASVGLVSSQVNAQSNATKQLGTKFKGKSYWVNKPIDGGSVKLYLWRKKPTKVTKGTILFVHGSSMAGTPTFDLFVEGRPEYSTMDYFAGLGYDTWCIDNEGYGRSDKARNINFNVKNGAEDLVAAVDAILQETGQSSIFGYGISSGSLKLAVYIQNNPGKVSRAAFDAFVWTGKGSPTLTERKKRIAQWQNSNRRPVDKAMIESVFTRDHAGTADPVVVEAFAKAVTELDDTMPTGTYLDMSMNLPLVDPLKLNLPILIMRGQYDGIAAFSDLMEFFTLLPHPDKHFSVMHGIAHASFQEKNVAIPYHILDSFMTMPKPIYSE
ncbi:MAG: alpha/beta fold hydrolase [Betaproteobacteria bacterium]